MLKHYPDFEDGDVLRSFVVHVSNTTTQTSVTKFTRILVLAGFAAFTLQSFQCASPEMSAARKAMKDKDYQKARTSAETVLKGDLDNIEALFILSNASQMMGDLQAATSALRRIQVSSAASPQQKNEASKTVFNLWVAEYNAGITTYNTFISTEKRDDAVKAAGHLTKAMELKPEFSEPLPLLGRIQLTLGDTAPAVVSFKRWWALEEKGFEIASSKGLVLEMPRAQVLRTMGTPIQQTSDSLQDGGRLFKDRYDVGGRDFMVFSTMGAGEVDGKVSGWTYAPASSLSAEEQRRTRTVTLEPLKNLALIEYAQKNPKGSFEWCTIVAKAHPTDGSLTPLRVRLYTELGRMDEALAEIQSLIKANATDMSYRITYASMLDAAGKGEQSRAVYEEVLGIEPANEAALLGLAAHWKGLAYEKQVAERDKAAKDPKYKRNDQLYFGDLRKSAEYYERIRKSPKYRGDLSVLEQLFNIYDVMSDSKSLAGIVRDLEALEPQYRVDPQWLMIMEGVYVRTNQIEKAKSIEARRKSLR